MSTLIFSAMDPNTSYKRLRMSGKKFLLRESRQSGMLTIDTVLDEKSESCRFGFIEPFGWKIVYGNQIGEFSKIIKKINMSTINLEKYVFQLLDMIYDCYNITLDDILRPNEVEVSRNSLYSSLYIQNELEKELILQIQCPISFKSGNEIEEPAFLYGQIYEYEDIKNWVITHGTCPLTRTPTKVEDIKKTKFIKLLLIK